MTAAGHPHADPGWVHHLPHEPNLVTPPGDGAFSLHLPDGSEQSFTVADLQRMPATGVPDCYIVSTGHGTSGPFHFVGVTLAEFLRRVLPETLAWRHVDVVSVDGFGTRLLPDDLDLQASLRPALLAYAVDGAPLTRARGLVRLIVPAERDDALRQVKWVSVIAVAAAESKET